MRLLDIITFSVCFGLALGFSAPHFFAGNLVLGAALFIIPFFVVYVVLEITGRVCRYRYRQSDRYRRYVSEGKVRKYFPEQPNVCHQTSDQQLKPDATEKEKENCDAIKHGIQVVREEGWVRASMPSLSRVLLGTWSCVIFTLRKMQKRVRH